MSTKDERKARRKSEREARAGDKLSATSRLMLLMTGGVPVPQRPVDEDHTPNAARAAGGRGRMNDLRHVTAPTRAETPPERKRGTPRIATPGYRGERVDCKMCGESARPDECQWGRWLQPEGHTLIGSRPRSRGSVRQMRTRTPMNVQPCDRGRVATAGWPGTPATLPG